VDLKHSWKETARKVLKQARLEAAHNKRIASILKELPEEDELDDDGMSLLALVLLPHLLPDVRSKPDPNRIVYFTQVCVALSDAACLAYIPLIPRPSHSSSTNLQY